MYLIIPSILPQTMRTLPNVGMKSLNYRQKNFATTGQLASGMLWLKTISLSSRSWSVFSVISPAGGMAVSITQTQAGDGWEELCSFLQKPIPETPYPRYLEVKFSHYSSKCRLNNVDQFQQGYHRFRLLSWMLLACCLLFGLLLPLVLFS